MTSSLFGPGDVETGGYAIIDGPHRYELGRAWGEGPRIVFVGLNPSTADGEQNDPTIRRCVGFAKSLGFDGLIMLNLFAWRATNPQELLASLDPIGERNDLTLREYRRAGHVFVACWGNLDFLKSRPLLAKRKQQVLSIIGQPKCLGLCSNGDPRHPLYLPANAKLMPYPCNYVPEREVLL